MKQNYSLQYIKMTKKKSNRYTEPFNFDLATQIDDTMLVRKHFKGVVFDQKIRSISFDSCLFEECTFTENVEKCVFINTKFKKCDFSNIMIVETGIHSCLFNLCRMIGTNICDSKLAYSDFLENNMRYISLSETALDNTIIKDSMLADGSMDKLDLKDIEFDNNDFSKMEIRNTFMKGVDLSSSKIEELRISPECIYGMIVNQIQAIELISILGIVIK